MCIQSSVCKNPPRVRKLARRNGLQERSSSRHGGDVHRPDYAVPCGNCRGGAQPCTDDRKCAQLWSFDGGGIGLKCACFLCWICLVIEGRNGTRSTTMLVEVGGKHICVCEALEEFVSFWLLSIWRQRRTRTTVTGLCVLSLWCRMHSVEAEWERGGCFSRVRKTCCSGIRWFAFWLVLGARVHAFLRPLQRDKDGYNTPGMMSPLFPSWEFPSCRQRCLHADCFTFLLWH